MAFDQKNSNSLINAQAKLLLPINQRNFANAPKWTIFRQLLTEINLALYNGSSDNFRTIETTSQTDGITTTNSKFNHFELLTKNNINGNFALDLFSHEAKGFFSYISLGYTSSFYRTSFKNTTVNSGVDDDLAKDTEETASLYSISHGPYLNIEVRPQTNFGADIGVSFTNLTYNGTETIGDINIRESLGFDGHNSIGLNYNIVHLKADFYWLANSEKNKKGGIFARIGGLYHTESKEIFPQLMVGYATNLTSFVNKFSPKEKESK
jgi:hypothetical protein